MPCGARTSESARRRTPTPPPEATGAQPQHSRSGRSGRADPLHVAPAQSPEPPGTRQSSPLPYRHSCSHPLRLGAVRLGRARRPWSRAGPWTASASSFAPIRVRAKGEAPPHLLPLLRTAGEALHRLRADPPRPPHRPRQRTVPLRCVRPARGPQAAVAPSPAPPPRGFAEERGRLKAYHRGS